MLNCNSFIQGTTKNEKKYNQRNRPLRTWSCTICVCLCHHPGLQNLTHAHRPSSIRCSKTPVAPALQHGTNLQQQTAQQILHICETITHAVQIAILSNLIPNVDCQSLQMRYLVAKCVHSIGVLMLHNVWVHVIHGGVAVINVWKAIIALHTVVAVCVLVIVNVRVINNSSNSRGGGQ